MEVICPNTQYFKDPQYCPAKCPYRRKSKRGFYFCSEAEKKRIKERKAEVEPPVSKIIIVRNKKWMTRGSRNRIQRENSLPRSQR